MVEARHRGSQLDFANAEHVVGAERGKRWVSFQARIRPADMMANRDDQFAAEAVVRENSLV